MVPRVVAAGAKQPLLGGDDKHYSKSFGMRIHKPLKTVTEFAKEADIFVKWRTHNRAYSGEYWPPMILFQSGEVQDME
jgi:hypothetical protein